MCNVGSARKHKMHVELEKLHLQQFLSHKSFAECFTEKKNRQHFIIIRRMTTAETARAVGLLQQYVSLTLHFCISPRSLNASIQNGDLKMMSSVCFVVNCNKLSAGDRDL